jgi:hypothetical protein
MRSQVFSGIRGGESSGSMLVLALALVPVLRGLAEGTKMDHGSTSSKISATSSRGGVRGDARRTVILSDFRTEGVAVVVPGTGRGSAWRRRRKVGASWGCSPGSPNRGFLLQLPGALLESREGASGKASQRGGTRRSRRA